MIFLCIERPLLGAAAAVDGCRRGETPLAALPQNEDGRTGPANPVRRSMGKLRLFAAFGLQREKRTAIPVAMRKKETHGQSRSCARKNTSCFGFGNGKAQEQRIAYLTYPGTFASAGITVTFSRGISPHSAAGPQGTGTLSCYELVESLYGIPRQLARAFSAFHRKRQASDHMTGSLPVVMRFFFIVPSNLTAH